MVFVYALFVSTHAPVKGATREPKFMYDEAGSFNPRPREGGDPEQVHAAAGARGFNPRPREGGDSSVN